MDIETISKLHDMFEEVQSRQDWRSALDRLFLSMRGSFVFDNVAIYHSKSKVEALDIIYARAMGRGKYAEADAQWGESVANEVMSSGKTVLYEPKSGRKSRSMDRMAQAHLLGLPMGIGQKLNGALVFVRFGGPKFTVLHKKIGFLQSFWATAIVEKMHLQEAREELDSVQRQMRLQDDFVSTISHELRTPLGFIKGYSTSLLRHDTTWDQDTQHEFLTIIDEEADRLTKLIEDMLESARLQSNTIQFKFSPVRLDALVRDIATRIKTHRPELKIKYDFEPIPPTWGDGTRLSQVFENLFSNAMKYAPNSEIMIGMKANGDRIRISFADQGEGIPEDFIPFIFERFYRVPGERTVTGTGLGLYICRQIIIAHHGNIWVESILDEGTTFVIELPIGSS